MGRRQKAKAAAAAAAAAPELAEAAASVQEAVAVAEPPQPAQRKAKRRKAAAEPVAEAEPAAEAGPATPAGEPKRKRRSYANAYTRKGQGFTALVDEIAFGPQAGGSALAVAQTEAAAQQSAAGSTVAVMVEAAAEAVAVAEVKQEPGAEAGGSAEKRPRKRRQKQDPNAPPPFELPEEEALQALLRQPLPPRPVPNLGFACLNATLRAQKPPVFSNRDCIKRTWEAKGVAWVGQLALENCRALRPLILWNHLHGIRFFRMSSKIFPWCTEYEFEQLPQHQEIAEALRQAGQLARALQQRLTFHPSHFVKLGCEPGDLLERSLKELEVHSQIFDLMGYEPSPWNKINIHIGGVYGDKQATLGRFAANFRRLSPGCAARLTVENDDWPNAFSIADLLPLHRQTGIPLVFDFHHHRFCPGGLTEEEAFKAAIATWPKGVRPVVHWSESQEGRRPSAHSDFVSGPLRLYGLEGEVDVMIEAKGKELALLRLRDPGYQPPAAALATLKDDG